MIIECLVLLGEHVLLLLDRLEFVLVDERVVVDEVVYLVHEFA